jgi:hypothetical protein
MANRATRRASGAKYPASLDEWAHDRLIKGLELPAVGDAKPRLVDFELPSLNVFAQLGDIPSPLAELAVRAEWDVEFSPLTAPNEERRTYYELMCWVIAWGLRKPDVLAELGTLEAAARWVSENIHDTAKVVIWARAQHMVSAEDVLAALTQSTKEVKGSDVASVADLGDFRGGPGSPAAPSDSGAAGAGP